jgi:SAM-dependent methyltransferase
MSSRTGSYVFGDSDLAARRLDLVAETFEAPTRKLLGHPAIQGLTIDRVGDLGCAHGRSTALVAEMLAARRTVGLELSDAYLALARRRASRGIVFHRHDVRTTPLPEAPYDLLFCRLLLSHLADPHSVIARWADELRPGGLLVLEEVEWIHTDGDVFARYLSIVEAMLASEGQSLYIGGALAAAPDPASLERCVSKLVEFPVFAARAAALFSLNAEVWRDHPFVMKNVGEGAMTELERALVRLRDAAEPGPSIVWGLRQLIFRRR